jgi:hypothetical protein
LGHAAAAATDEDQPPAASWLVKAIPLSDKLSELGWMECRKPPQAVPAVMRLAPVHHPSAPHQADKQYYIADASAKLYRASAYYAAKQLAVLPFALLNTLVSVRSTSCLAVPCCLAPPRPAPTCIARAKGERPPACCSRNARPCLSWCGGASALGTNSGPSLRARPAPRAPPPWPQAFSFILYGMSNLRDLPVPIITNGAISALLYLIAAQVGWRVGGGVHRQW